MIEEFIEWMKGLDPKTEFSYTYDKCIISEFFNSRNSQINYVMISLDGVEIHTSYGLYYVFTVDEYLWYNRVTELIRINEERHYTVKHILEILEEIKYETRKN